MKGKYINTKILLASMSKPQSKKKDIHSQLKETIAEHKRIMRHLEKILSVTYDSAMQNKEAA